MNHPQTLCPSDFAQCVSLHFDLYAKSMGRKSMFDSAFKTKVVLDALKEKETLSELAKKYGVAPKQITDWKKEFLEKSGSVFGEEHSESKELKSLKAENERLLKKVGQLTIEVDFFAEACEAAGLKRK